jgi:hypothetical protein
MNQQAAFRTLQEMVGVAPDEQDFLRIVIGAVLAGRAIKHQNVQLLQAMKFQRCDLF